MLTEILKACKSIDSPRTIGTVVDHLNSEVYELNQEVVNVLLDSEQGEDGVLGESVDVILCAVDLIYQENPKVTKAEIMAVVNRKIEKWVTLYGNQSKTEKGESK